MGTLIHTPEAIARRFEAYGRFFVKDNVVVEIRENVGFVAKTALIDQRNGTYLRKVMINTDFDKKLGKEITDPARREFHMLGLEAHELLHQILTPFDEISKRERMLPASERKNYHRTQNLCQDYWIEAAAPVIFAGAILAALISTIAFCYETAPNLETLSSSDGEHIASEVSNALIMVGDRGPVKGHFSCPEAKEVFDKVIPLFEQIGNENDAIRVVDLTDEIYAILRPYFAAEGDSQINDRSEMPEGRGEGSNRPEETPRVVVKRPTPETAPEPEPEENDGEERNEGGEEQESEEAEEDADGEQTDEAESGDTDESDSDDESESSDTSDDEPDEDGSEDESGDEPDDDDESESENNGETPDDSDADENAPEGASEGDTDEEDASADEDGENESDSSTGDSEGKKDEVDADGEPNDETDDSKAENDTPDEDESEDITSKDDKDTSKDDGDDSDTSDEEDDADYDESEPETSDADENGCAEDDDAENDEAEYEDGGSEDDSESDEFDESELPEEPDEPDEPEAPDPFELTDDEIRSAMEDTARDLDREQSELEREQAAERIDDEYGDIPADKADIEHIIVESGDPELYDTLVGQSEIPISVLEKKLKAIIRGDRGGKQYASTGGHISVKRLACGELKKDIKVNRTAPQNCEDMQVHLLVDESGSMDGSKAEVARLCAIILYEAFKRLGIKVAVTGFTTDQWGNVAISRHFTTEKTPLSSRTNLTEISSWNYNCDAHNIAVETEFMLKRHATHRLMVVMSDGEPRSLPFDQKRAEDLVKDAVTDARSRGIDVMAVAIQPSDRLKYATMYGKDFVWVDRTDNLVPQVIKVMTDIVRRWRR